jgi:hypothetical protein
MTKGKSAATKTASAIRSKQPPRKAKTKLEQLEAMLRRSAVRYSFRASNSWSTVPVT